MTAPTFVLAALLFGPSDPVPASAPHAPSIAVEADSLQQLLTLRRVYVDRFSGGETAAQMRDMIINGLQSSKLFTITENQEKADAILRGSGEDLVFTEQHSSSDSLNVHSNLGLGRSADSGALRGGSHVSNSTNESTGLAAEENESSHSVERRHEATNLQRLEPPSARLTPPRRVSGCTFNLSARSLVQELSSAGGKDANPEYAATAGD